jgi:hypothetical protein
MAQTRYNEGVITVSHKGKDITTSVGSQMDDFISTMDTRYTYQIGKIPAEHDVRPDLTSFVFYDTVSRWWLMLQFNNINDPFEGYTAGKFIKIPNL